MGNTILVVDRSKDFIELMEMVLGEEGFIVVSCSDAASGYENAKRFKPQIAFIDLVLSGQGGWDLIRKLRADPETLRMHIVVCTTAQLEVNKRSHLMQRLNLNVLPKPFDLTDLVNLLKSLPTRCPHH